MNNDNYERPPTPAEKHAELGTLFVLACVAGALTLILAFELPVWATLSVMAWCGITGFLAGGHAALAAVAAVLHRRTQ